MLGISSDFDVKGRVFDVIDLIFGSENLLPLHFFCGFPVVDRPCPVLCQHGSNDPLRSRHKGNGGGALFEIDTGSFTWSQQKKTVAQMNANNAVVPGGKRGTALPSGSHMGVACPSAPRSSKNTGGCSKETVGAEEHHC